MDKTQKEIVDLIDQLVTIKTAHTKTVEGREKLESDPEQEDKSGFFDEELIEWEYEIEEIASKIQDLVSELSITKEW